MIKKIAVAAAFAFAASTLIGASIVGATTPHAVERTANEPQQSEWDPIYPDCNECIWVTPSSPVDGVPPGAPVWVCPTPMHYSICPA